MSWLFYTSLQNKTQCVGVFAQTYKTKHTTVRSLLLRDRQKILRKYIVSKGLSGLKTFPNN